MILRKTVFATGNRFIMKSWTTLIGHLTLGKLPQRKLGLKWTTQLAQTMVGGVTVFVINVKHCIYYTTNIVHMHMF